MPIRPEERARYPKNWPDIRARIQARAGDKCEWCGAENHKPHPVTGAMVVCTTAHLNHTPEDCRDENLKFLCQKCHNGYDAKHRAAGIKERIGRGNLELFV
jgi:5-methylcytosine-specific restriction endonuclease McrA